MSRQLDRQKGAPWFNTLGDKIIDILGSGGIGSWVALFLCRAGFKIQLIDYDHVELHNIGGQLFSPTQIGLPKILAVHQNIRHLVGKNAEILANLKRVEEGTPLNSIVISCFDNMEARTNAFTSWKEANHEQGIYIDGRLNAEYFEIYCVDATDVESIEKYEREKLFDDSLVPDIACTFKQTSHIAAMIGGMICSLFTNWATNTFSEQGGRKIPYQTKYFAPMVMLTKS